MAQPIPGNSVSNGLFSITTSGDVSVWWIMKVFTRCGRGNAAAPEPPPPGPWKHQGDGGGHRRHVDAELQGLGQRRVLERVLAQFSSVKPCQAVVELARLERRMRKTMITRIGTNRNASISATPARRSHPA